jgi:probable F420-dependent oxidoreductase
MTAIDLGQYGIWVSSFAVQGAPEAASELDALGYGAVWLGGVFNNLDHPAQVVADTTRIKVVPGILSIWTMDAAAAARQYAEIDAASPGRFVLGLGVSHGPLVEPSGQQYARPYSKMVEYLDALDAAPAPVPKDRIVLAALGPKMLKLSATRAGGAHPYLVTPAHTAEARSVLGNGVLLAPEQKVLIATDASVARAVARATLAIYLGLPNYVHNFERIGFTADDFAGGGSDRLLDAMVAWGTVDQVVARVREHLDAGADHVAIQALNADPAAARRSVPTEAWRELAGALGL